MLKMTEQEVKQVKPSVSATADRPVASGNSDRFKLVALIPRGEVIRNFVYSGAFDIVADEADLSLISVSPDSELESWLKRKFGSVFPLRRIKESWTVRSCREILDIAHGRWLWSNAAQERWRLRDIEAVGFKLRSKRILKKAISFPFSSRTGLKLLGAFERKISRILSNNAENVQLLKEIKPSLVFNGSHVHSENAVQVVQAAQWLGIPTATFIFSWDNLTSQGRIFLPYDYFIVWNDELKNQMLEMYDWIRPENVFVTGTPQFDFHFRQDFYHSREQFFEGLGANPDRPLVLYSTGMANHMPGEHEIIEQIADILADTEGAPQLVVRVYPKDRTGRFQELKERRKDILFPLIAWHESWLTPEYKDSYDLVNMLRYVNLGINIASTISLELCMFDKPVINVGFNPPSVSEDEKRFADYYNFDHYKPLVDCGAIEVAWDSVELRELIETALVNPGKRAVERRKLIEGFFGSTLDGKSAERIARVLIDLASGVTQK